MTFDVHIEEILGTLIMCGQLIILRPYGELDMEMFSRTINRHQVTYLSTVPSQIINIAMFLHEKDQDNALKTLRCISSGGKDQF